MITFNNEEQIRVFSGYLNKFRNKLFGLLNEREKDREWEKFLDSIEIELAGFPDQLKTINYYELSTKISWLRHLNWPKFRTTIFECMNLVGRLEPKLDSGDKDGVL